MTMSKHEIERALIELRLSGMAATLETRILQAQANEQPFSETFCMLLQDEQDLRRSRLTERRFKQCGLDERLTLADFDWHFNPKVPRQACFELHTLKFITEGIRKGCCLPGHPAGLRCALRGGRQRVCALLPGQPS